MRIGVIIGTLALLAGLITAIVMNAPVAVLVLSFILLLVMNVPIAISIGVSSLLTTLVALDVPAFTIMAQKMATGVDAFSLLAIPFLSSPACSWAREASPVG